MCDKKDSSAQQEYQYSDYIIAYIDILGVKERLKNDDGSLIKSIGNTINIAKESIEDTGYSFNVKIFSDNFCIAKKIDDGKGVNVSDQLFWTCLFITKIQEEIFCKEKLLLRGGITIGKLFIDDLFVIGDGLVNAYKLESEIAEMPKIIVDKTFYEIVSHSVHYDKTITCYKMLISDSDKKEDDISQQEYRFLNYLNGGDSELKQSMEETLKSKMEIAEKLFNECKDEEPRKKIEWVLTTIKRQQNPPLSDGYT